MADLAHVKGLDKLNDFLQSVPVKLEKNILRGALRAGTNDVKAEAQIQLATHGNVKSGLLAKGLRVSTNSKGGTVTASLKAKGKHGYIGYWLEFTGAAPHVITSKSGKAISFAGGTFKSINHPGFSPKPFMRPALDSRAGMALVTVGNYIKARLTKEGLDTSEVDIGEV